MVAVVDLFYMSIMDHHVRKIPRKRQHFHASNSISYNLIATHSR